MMAHQKLSTWNPSIRFAVNKIIIALITNKKSPKVKMVIGRVRITRIGFTKKLSKLNTTATIIAVNMDETPTPGRT